MLKGFLKLHTHERGKKVERARGKEKVTECLHFEGEKEEVDVEQKCRGVSAKERVW